MKLNAESLKTSVWKEKGYALPTFDREKMINETVANPEWVHFGAGNIFRAFQANLAQRMLAEGLNDKGLTVVEGFDYEIIEKMYRPHDNLSILVTLKADGSVEVVNKYISQAVNDVKDKASTMADKMKEKVQDVNEGIKTSHTAKKSDDESETTFTYTVNFSDEDDKE